MSSSKFVIISAKSQNKKILFDDNADPILVQDASNFNNIDLQGDEKKEKVKNEKSAKRKRGHHVESANDEPEELEKKWFELYSAFNTFGDLVELKDSEMSELSTLCRTEFEAEFSNFQRKNPSDAKWLETALHKGTSKDRANAGALLVQTNPLGNLKSLETLIGLCKASNKAVSDVLSVLSELFQEALLPPTRKLLSLPLRGADWRSLRKREDVSKELRQQVYAYWYFESQLKEQYFSFLQNMQNTIQASQDTNKNSAIINAAKLLTYAPEKEQMLLSMLVNKLGDPSNKVASKALHHLSDVAYKHPNMCGVITLETEKLLFRNNVSERAQHFALCFLAQVAPSGHPEVCTKLVNICFSFFKVLVQKGAVNNKTMQAILRCLQKAIVEAKPASGSTAIMTKEMQDTIYRLVHLADIRISIQTLSLLLQLVSIKTEKSDRFYNALYKKMLDLNLATVGTKTAAQFLHIIHRAVHMDQNVKRVHAFIKRLLQLTMYVPSQIAAGCLIVLYKILNSKKELSLEIENREIEQTERIDLDKFNSDGEEKYEDVHSDTESCDKKEVEKNTDVCNGWLWQKNVQKDDIDINEKKNITDLNINYDPYNRSSAYAGGELSIKAELLAIKQHFHPTVKVFAENIIYDKKIDYYGDPLRDFSLAYFLERFAFKNPKKIEEKTEEIKSTKSFVQSLHQKKYVPSGGRGQPVSSLTKTNCTEDELFIFNYLEKKRETQIVNKTDNDDVEDVDDDEFENYLDGLCRKAKSHENEEDDEDDEPDFDVDYLQELGDDLKFDEDDNKNKKKGRKTDDGDDDEPDGMDDWGDDDMSIDDDTDDENNELVSADEEGSISLDEGDSMSEDVSSGEDDSEDNEPQLKKSKKAMNGKNFSKALKSKDDISSLFAAADDFAELLEETGKTKGHGTSNAVFNKDKSSAKQLKWEEKRHSSFGKFNKAKSKKPVRYNKR